MGNLTEGARIILAESSVPLSAAQILEQLLSRKLWQTSGKTPEATVGAALYTDIKKYANGSFFVKAGKGLFALNRNREELGSQKKTNTTLTARHNSEQSNQTPLSFLECAERVLREIAQKNPMHYKTITTHAIENGWLQSNGLTPEASMGAQIYTYIKRCESQGRRSIFSINKGYVSLTEWIGSPLEQQIEQHNENVRQELLNRVMNLEPVDFEKLVLRLLICMGFSQAEQTKPSGDHGIDVKGTLNIHDTINLKLAVQVKRWKNNIQAPHIQNLRGSLRTYEQGLFVTTSDFSKGAKEEAKRKDAHCDIALINGSKLIDNLVKYHLGVTLNRYHLLTLKDSFFDDNEELDAT
ncbi:MAG: restriction endonuclease [Akkermansia sp.]|nr:restriction endonuclease [Akkermansia sp.]